MRCKVCNNPMPAGDTHCPACGTTIGAHMGLKQGKAAKKRPSKLPSGHRAAIDDDYETIDPLLGDELEDDLDEKPAAPAAPAPREKPAAPAKSTTSSKSAPAAKSVAADKPTRRRSRNDEEGPRKPDPATLRGMLGLEPGMLEEGLSVYEEKRGQPVGAGFSTDVGEIDLLARDASGSLVVIMVADPDDDADLVAQMLQRVGWVGKHIAKKKNEAVRGLLLVDETPPDLGYAAAAVAGTITVKSYRFTLAFDDVEL